jgi:hypothetical protein
MNAECELCGGTGFMIVERGSITAAKPCTCCGRASKSSKPGIPLTAEVAAVYTATICDTLAFAPPKEAKLARAHINNRLLAMCDSEEQLKWLTDRVCDLYTKWEDCGIPGLRQMLCLQYRPKDGIELFSTKSYPDGIPLEKPQLESVSKALPPGHAVSASPSIEAAVSDLSDAKRMPAAGDGLRIVPPVVRRIPEVQPNPDAPKITQADIDQEVARLRRAKAK